MTTTTRLGTGTTETVETVAVGTMTTGTVDDELGALHPHRQSNPSAFRSYSNIDMFFSRRGSPLYEAPPQDDYNPDEPKEDDSEARSVFVSQLAARLSARELGYFFEDKLGEGTVMDARIVTDRLSRRSKGYV